MTYEEQAELKRLLAEAAKVPAETVSEPSMLYAKIRGYARSKVEKFGVVTLNGAHEVIRVRTISKGLVNRTIVHPREVFRPAIRDNASAVILFHNHPSGHVQASHEDTELTKRLTEAGKIIGIPVLDHLIITQKTYFSFMQGGLL